MTKQFSAPNNLEQDDYDRIVVEKQKEWESCRRLQDDDIMILQRPAYFELHYIYYRGQFRFLGQF